MGKLSSKPGYNGSGLSIGCFYLVYWVVNWHYWLYLVILWYMLTAMSF